MTWTFPVEWSHCLLVIILAYYTVVFLHRYVWVPFKLYVVAQISPGYRLKDFGEWAVITGSTDGIGKLLYGRSKLVVYYGD